MPHFHFHLWREGELTPDEVGAVLPSLDAARHRAERLAAIFGQGDDAPASAVGWDIEVTDQAGRTVLLVPVGDERGSPPARRAA